MNNQKTTFIGWLIAWLLMFLLLYLLSKTRSGHSIIYYTSWLLVVLLIVTHYKEVNNILTGGFGNA